MISPNSTVLRKLHKFTEFKHIFHIHTQDSPSLSVFRIAYTGLLSKKEICLFHIKTSEHTLKFSLEVQYPTSSHYYVTASWEIWWIHWKTQEMNNWATLWRVGKIKKMGQETMYNLNIFIILNTWEKQLNDEAN